ncbi:MAG: amidase family protein, partial [Thermoanaerobaculia bacterium]|nr:amidase family protein [Thermoanaerobaculia bacterium]
MGNGDGAPLYFQGLLDVSARMRTGDLSPVAVTETLLERIAGVDPALHSSATVMADEARAAAHRAEEEIAAGSWRGPLHGVPVAVKDLCYTRGTRTMGGHAFLRDFVPDHDATVVTRLADAGAVLLGKLSLTEAGQLYYDRAMTILNEIDEARLAVSQL